jgi:hypothetical protein
MSLSRVTRRHFILLPLLFLVLFLFAACAPALTTPAARGDHPTPTAIPAATRTDADGRGRTRTDADARGRIHNASPGYIPLFASVTFTVDTTYDQAQAILRGHVYPWTCDEPRSDAPPPLAEQQANFAAWHGLLMSYPTWDELARIASSPQVVSVDGTPLYPCP